MSKYHMIGNQMSRLIPASAAVCSKAMNLLLFVHCLLLFPLGVGGGGFVLGTCFVVWILVYVLVK